MSDRQIILYADHVLGSGLNTAENAAMTRHTYPMLDAQTANAGRKKMIIKYTRGYGERWWHPQGKHKQNMPPLCHNGVRSYFDLPPGCRRFWLELKPVKRYGKASDAVYRCTTWYASGLSRPYVLAYFVNKDGKKFDLPNKIDTIIERATDRNPSELDKWAKFEMTCYVGK